MQDSTDATPVPRAVLPPNIGAAATLLQSGGVVVARASSTARRCAGTRACGCGRSERGRTDSQPVCSTELEAEATKRRVFK